MAESAGIRAGAAFVELFLKDNALNKGLTKASSRLKAFGTSISSVGKKMIGLGAMATAPLIGFAKVAASGAHELELMSKRTGIAIDVLSELGYAASMAGVDASDLERSIKLMQKTLVGAATGSDSANEALSRLKLTVKDLDGLTPDEQFKQLADRISKIENPAIRAAMALKLFGRSGTALLPMMEGGSAGIEEWQQAARSLGLTASVDGVKATGRLERTLTTLWKVVKKIGTTMGSAIAPILTEFAIRMIRLTAVGVAFVKANKETIKTVFKVAMAIKLAGIAILALGTAITSVAGIVGGIVTVLKGAGTVVAVLGAAIAALTTPIGLTLVAIGALATFLIVATGSGGKAIAWLGERFRSLYQTVQTVMQGIGDALAANDLSLGAKILWLSLKLTYENGIAVLKKAWVEFSTFFVKLAAGAFFGVQKAGEYLWHGMRVAWIEGVAFLRQVWATFAAWHAGASEAMANAMVKSWIWAREKTGEITTEQAKFERQYTQQQHEQEARKIEADRKVGIEQARQQRIRSAADEERRHDANLAGIGQGYQGASDQLEAERVQKMSATEKALADARAEWQKSIGDAKAKRELLASAGPDPLQKYMDRLGGLGGLMEEVKDKVSVAGTFNALEAPGLAGGGVGDRIASATEQTAKNTKKLLERAVDGMSFE